jgi:hypothetical protein
VITERAIRCFEQAMQAAMTQSLASEGAAGFHGVRGPGPAPAGDMVMLSIAAADFSAMFFLHQDDAGGDLAEQGNLCCGSLNRELNRRFPNLGMSTPCRLDGRSLEHLDLLDPGYVGHFVLERAGGAMHRATLCVCEHGDLDFDLPPAPQVAEAEAGELELF